jgi:hypothetical protein
LVLTGFLPDSRPQRVVHLLPDADLAPAQKVAIHRPLRREMYDRLLFRLLLFCTMKMARIKLLQHATQFIEMNRFLDFQNTH